MISIIIPAYNAEKTIEKCVESVLAQSHRAWELLIVDDGSRDATGAICDALAAADARIRVFHKENGGVVLARSHALAHAAGEYVAFVDSDDTVHPEMLEKMAAAAGETGADIVSCGYRELYADGKVLDRVPKHHGSMEEGSFFSLLFQLGTQGFLWNKLYRRELLAQVCAPAGMTVCEDLYINALLLKQPRKVAVLPDCLYNYCMNPESVTHTIERKIDSQGRWKYLEAYKQILEAVADIPPYRAVVLDAAAWVIKLGVEELTEAGTHPEAVKILRGEMMRFLPACLKGGNSLRFKLGYMLRWVKSGFSV